MEASSFAIHSPSENQNIEMFSPSFYAACTFGGSLSCGLTHTGITPLDVVKPTTGGVAPAAVPTPASAA
ncbi:Phosphate carrier protein, mitochondrial [Glycine soja]|nr:Phosphate carrier protein, mitochondrial [Glycine soja]